MRFLFSSSLLLLLFSITGFAQNGACSLQSPIKHTLRLSGTFGELRSNHFHAGIDIKGMIGEPILSAEDGYVSRIKVSGSGYGKVLYVTHPNGYTSVYAHLREFKKSIQEYIEDYQYKHQKFDIEIYPDPEQFVVKKGEEIAKMGLTGHTFGPHLHFEVRETDSEKPVNPLLMGLKVEDNLAPRLHEIRVYEMTDQFETIDATTFALFKGKNAQKYQVKGDTVFVRSNVVGVALKAYDHMTGVTNWNGLFSCSMLRNDSLVFEFKLDGFSLDDTRYINAHLDYQQQLTKQSYFNRCFQLPGNLLPIYHHVKNKGIIILKQDKAERITLIAADANGNTTKAEFWIKKSRLPEKKFQPVYNYFLPFDEENMIDNGSMILYMPEGTLYENLYLDFASTTEESADIYSSYYHIHDHKTPVHKFYDLSIFPYKLPEVMKDKAFIAYCPPGGSVVNYGGKWEGKMLRTKVRDLGDFTVMIDTIAPTVKPYQFKANMQGIASMMFTIHDNFRTAGNAEGLSWYATIDDQWILMELDAKKNRLIYNFDDRIPRGKHTLKLSVWDGKGNKTTLEKEFLN